MSRDELRAALRQAMDETGRWPNGIDWGAAGDLDDLAMTLARLLAAPTDPGADGPGLAAALDRALATPEGQLIHLALFSTAGWGTDLTDRRLAEFVRVALATPPASGDAGRLDVEPLALALLEDEDGAPYPDDVQEAYRIRVGAVLEAAGWGSPRASAPSGDALAAALRRALDNPTGQLILTEQRLAGFLRAALADAEPKDAQSGTPDGEKRS